MMKLIIVSGLSGSGKTVALHTMEDEEYYCVDNLPLGLLPDLTDQLLNRSTQPYNHVAVGIDARSETSDLHRFAEIIQPLKHKDIDVEIIFLQADLPTLIKRFSDTRRKHPLSRKGLPLSEALDVERTLLSEVAQEADITIDTTYINVHQLRGLIKSQVLQRKSNSLAILFQSFGFKHGAPTDSDFVFDIRCLPNPHWEPKLRHLTGLDKEVIDYLEKQEDVHKMFTDISRFLQTWITKFEQQNRYYLTVSIGCTGGQHRSVYMAEQLHKTFLVKTGTTSIRHRELQ
jgi:UPF0042 nucleotide-binding protein